MTLQQLRYLITVAEEKSISKAAQRLFISQPSLTVALHELEKEFNIVLFTRSNKGVILSPDGEVFLSYARQVLEQAKLLEDRYKGDNNKILFSVSTQHFSFAVNAFIELIEKYNSCRYDFSIRETLTHEIIEDVSKFKSEIGLLHINSSNRNVLLKLINDNELDYDILCNVTPHVFISKTNPLANKDIIELADLYKYPYLSFEQGDHNSFNFIEEVVNVKMPKNIKVRDRASLFNLLIGIDGFTIASGLLDEKLNANIVSKPLNIDENIEIIIITRKNVILSEYAKFYIKSLKKLLK